MGRKLFLVYHTTAPDVDFKLVLFVPNCLKYKSTLKGLREMLVFPFTDRCWIGIFYTCPFSLRWRAILMGKEGFVKTNGFLTLA